MGRSEMVGPFKHIRRSWEGEDEYVGMNQKFSKGKHNTVTSHEEDKELYTVSQCRGEERRWTDFWGYIHL